MHVKLISLSETHIDEEVFEVTVPTTGGVIAVNDRHAPLLGAIAPGLLYIRRKKSDPDSSREELGVYDGTIEVLNNTVQILVDQIDAPGDVSQADAEAALKRAQELKEKAGDVVSLEKAQAMIDRQEVRLKLAGLKKSNKKRY